MVVVSAVAETLQCPVGRMTVDAMTVASVTQRQRGNSDPDVDSDMEYRGLHGQTAGPGRSRFMITDILSGPPGLTRSPCSSPGSSSGEPDAPRDLSVHGRDIDSDGDGHDSCTDSVLREGSVCSNGRSLIDVYSKPSLSRSPRAITYQPPYFHKKVQVHLPQTN